MTLIVIVVSDTSPISNLIDLQQIRLLPDLFGEVYIPQIVADELDLYSDDSFANEWKRVKQEEWLKICTPTNSVLSSTESPLLDPGETAAISLALELGAELLLIDERAGFRAAKSLHLKTLGVLGILIQAKQSGMIPAVMPLLDRLRNEIGFWVSDSLYTRVLKIVEE